MSDGTSARRDVAAEVLPMVAEFNEVLEPDELLPTIARLLRRLVDYRALDIYVPEKSGTLVAAHVAGVDPNAPRRRLQPGEGLVGTAAQNRQPVFVPDVRRDPRYVAEVPGIVSEMAVPLLHRDRLVAVLNIECTDAGQLNQDVRHAVLLLANHMAVALDNAMLYRETRWYAGLLATLYEIGKETASILDLDELLARVAEIVKRVIDYEIFGILLLDEEKEQLVLRKAVRFGPIQEKTRISAHEGLCGAAVSSKEPVLVGDVRVDPRYLNLIPETRSELVVPLVHKDHVIGVFDLASPELDRFNEEHVKVLTPLASQVAVAIENARLVDEIVRKEERLDRELAIAREIQHGLIPEECPQSHYWDASAHFMPARELGGDLYDFYEIEDGVLGLALGDVSGKGVPAALYAAFASGTVRARAFERHGPADLMSRVNRTLSRRGTEGIFCTLAYALFDFKRSLLTIASSGLPHPVHYEAKTHGARHVEIAGLPLGMFEKSTYDQVTLPLVAGDVFVFYSDGVVEARDDNDEYGSARLRALVEAHADAPAWVLGEHILTDVGRFVGDKPPADDLTFAVVKIR